MKTLHFIWICHLKGNISQTWYCVTCAGALQILPWHLLIPSPTYLKQTVGAFSTCWVPAHVGSNQRFLQHNNIKITDYGSLHTIWDSLCPLSEAQKDNNVQCDISCSPLNSCARLLLFPLSSLRLGAFTASLAALIETPSFHLEELPRDTTKRSNYLSQKKKKHYSHELQPSSN